MHRIKSRSGRCCAHEGQSCSGAQETRGNEGWRGRPFSRLPGRPTLIHTQLKVGQATGQQRRKGAGTVRFTDEKEAGVDKRGSPASEPMQSFLILKILQNNRESPGDAAVLQAIRSGAQICPGLSVNVPG